MFPFKQLLTIFKTQPSDSIDFFQFKREYFMK